MVANESNPAAFITPGTAQVSASGYTLSLTGLQENSEIRVYAVSDNSELAGVENSTTTFEWSYEYSGDFDVNIYIHNVNYDYIAFRNLTVSNADASIPIQQRFDRYKI
jgi:hypothetical protein